MKTFTVQATNTLYYQTHISVPDHWTKKDILNYFQQAGVMGEFHETGSGWKWGAVIENPNLPKEEIDSIFP